MSVIEFEVPVRIESEMNKRGHWRGLWSRGKKQKEAVYWAFREAVRQTGTIFVLHVVKRPIVVTLTRIAPRPITDEHDNLRSGFKATVDMIAELICCDDGDKDVTWLYAQEKGKPKSYSIRVRIETRT